jgi:hypothetical protein
MDNEQIVQPVSQPAMPVSPPLIPAQPLPSQDAGDVPKNTILVLLVLTIFVSAFGTWVILRATEQGLPQIQIQTLKEMPTQGITSAQGIIAVTIGPVQKTVPKPVSTTGYVSLSIAQPNTNQGG